MSTEITKKQAILLSILGIVLVMICFVQFLIRPLLTRSTEAKEQIETLNQEYQVLVQQSESYDQNVQALEEWNEKNSEETTRLFPLSNPQRVDRVLTFVMNECGVQVQTLSIGQLLQYYVDGEGNLVAEDPSAVEAAAQNAEAASEEAAAAATYTATGEYRCDFTYTMQGTYDDMRQMMRFINNVSFLGLSSYSFNSMEDPNIVLEEGQEREEKLEDWYSFTMTISAYMYKSPLQSEELEAEEGEEKAADAAADAAEDTAAA